jgi:hypothetical protein
MTAEALDVDGTNVPTDPTLSGVRGHGNVLVLLDPAE